MWRVVVVFALTGACGRTEGTPDVVPTIEVFRVEPSTVVTGAPALFTWFVSHADEVSLSPSIGLVRGNSFTVAATASTTYRLTVRRGQLTAYREASLEVVPATAAPAPPSDVRVHTAGVTHLLTWSAAPDASGWRVERRTQFEVDYQLLSAPAGASTAATDSGGDANALNFYRVLATNEFGTSGAVELSVLHPPPPPEGPAALEVSPTIARLAPGDSVQLNVAAPGADWFVAESGFGGTVSADGLYTAPGSSGAFHVVVTSGGRTGFAVITVGP